MFFHWRLQRRSRSSAMQLPSPRTRTRRKKRQQVAPAVHIAFIHQLLNFLWFAFTSYFIYLFNNNSKNGKNIAVKYIKYSYNVTSISQRYINATQPRYYGLSKFTLCNLFKKQWQKRLDGCIVWNAHNTVLGEEALVIYVVPVGYVKTGRYGKT